MLVRVLLVEDHEIFRDLFAYALERELGFEVVAHASTLAEARRLLDKEVDVAVLDFSLPDGNGTDLIGELRARNPHAVALVLTASIDLLVHAQAVQAGAASVLHKSASVKDLMDAMQRLAAGEALLSQEEVVELLRVADNEFTQNREARRAIEQLTSRERDVLQALAEGMNDKEIAERLNVAVGTARRYVADMLAKLGVHSRLQALVFAARHGFVEIGPKSTPR